MIKTHNVIDTKEKILIWLYNNRVDDCYVNDDLTVDVKGDLHLVGSDFYEIPVKFNRVHGYFSCYDCINLTSLKNSPLIVGNILNCQKCCNLNTFDGCPSIVNNGFKCEGTIFEKPLKILGKNKMLEIFSGIKPVSRENQELLVKLALNKDIEWHLIEPWLDKETIEKYRTVSSLSKMGF